MISAITFLHRFYAVAALQDHPIEVRINIGLHLRLL